MSKKKKIILILAIVILGIIVVLQVSGMNKKIKKYIVENIDYDIKVTYVEEFPAPGGYASQNTYYLINIENRNIYEIDDYYVFGVEEDASRTGHNYTITKNKISDDKINSLISYAEQELDETESLKLTYRKGYWLVEYQDKKAKINNFNYSPAQ